MSKLIVIDPGHGGADPGAVNGSRFEKNDNLRMSLAIRDRLRAQGHNVIMTREGDTNPSLDQRIAVANNNGADLFISVHRNSFTNPVAHGIENWIRNPAHREAAEIVLSELAKEPNQANRGVKQGNYRVLLGAEMPAMLIEIGFISNTEDNRLFDAHFDAYATAIARGILSALGEPFTEPARPSAQPLYRVQVGAFSVRANAEAFLQKVRDMGLDAFIVPPTDTR